MTDWSCVAEQVYARLPVPNWDQDVRKAYQPVPADPATEAREQRAKALALYERCLFISSAFSAACFAAWITWVPFIHLLIPDIERETENHVTTVSHTFQRYNPTSTIFLIIPLTIFFMFRNFRVFINTSLRDEEKKTVFIMLIISQISIFIVTRYDAIRGTWHYLFTFATISLLYVYHALVRDPYQCIFFGLNVKTMLMTISVVAILCFAGLFIAFDDIQERPEIWTVACIAEVFGLLTLGALDVVDIYTLGFHIDQSKNKD